MDLNSGAKQGLNKVSLKKKEGVLNSSYTNKVYFDVSVKVQVYISLCWRMAAGGEETAFVTSLQVINNRVLDSMQGELCLFLYRAVLW